MRFCILVQGSVTSAAPFSALRFATAALQAGHQIERVFFVGEAVGIARASNVTPQDERNLGLQWSQLAQEHQLDMVVCVSAALKQGVLDEGEAQRYEKGYATLLAGFTLSGLGQLIEASLVADRTITFGG